MKKNERPYDFNLRQNTPTQDIFPFYRNVCSTNKKQTLDKKLLIFPCAYFWNSYFVISACIDAMKKNERPYDFNLRQNTPMGVTSRGRDLKNFKSRALQAQWRQILSEIAFQIFTDEIFLAIPTS